MGASGLGVAIGLMGLAVDLPFPFLVVGFGVGFWLCKTSLRSCLGRICACKTIINKQSTPKIAMCLYENKLLNSEFMIC